MRRRITLPAVACLAVTCLLGVPAPGVTAQVAPLSGRGPTAAGNSLARAPGLTRVETPVTPAVPVPGVAESYVQLYDPLPASDGPVPPACNRIGYLRFRSTAGPASSLNADAVMTLMPGDEAGAALYVNQARLVVQDAAAQGKHVEVWIISRRSNCLVDTTGLRAAAAAHDWQVAIDYYYHGASIGGHTFAGFLTSADVPFLADFGLQQTLDDWASVIVNGMPNAADRSKKMYCGGHSLGGPITAALADWDFNGTPGYTLCAGFFGEDTLVTTGIGGSASPGVQQGLDVIGSLGLGAVNALLASGAIDRIQEFAVFDPQTLLSIQATGIQAFYHPNQVSDLAAVLPASLRGSLQFFLSQNALADITGNPPATGYQLTSQSLLATFLDANTEPIGAFQAGLGTYDGPVIEKDFPATSPTQMMPANQTQAYPWIPYNKIATAPVQLNSSGQPFFSPREEVSDINTVAEVLTDQPVTFTEPYFPTRLLTDVGFMILGNRGGDLSHLKYDGIDQRPLETILGGDGLVTGSGLPIPGDAVIVPHYHHLDVGGLAAGVQNNGRPEEVSTTLTHFILTGIPGPA
jgi:hypothetical protein